MTDLNRRALHFVLKIGDRKKTISYLESVLQMTILRHEEFAEGCKATCNGPYDGRWSKTMIGYGPEDDNFVLELTYNYGIGSYQVGNDFKSITIRLPNPPPEKNKGDLSSEDTLSPAGYNFKIIYDPSVAIAKVEKVSLACSNLVKSLKFWVDILEMNVGEKTTNFAELFYGDDQTRLELVESEGDIDRGTAFGRIAFSCPGEDVKRIEQKVKEAGYDIHTPHVSLETPGKATVEVVILSDPDGHEICFVGDEAFRELSKIDVEANSKLNAAIEEDHSDDWFKKHRITKK